jgi:hypothetical protein
MQRVPHLPWGSIWLVAFVTTLCLSAGAEAFWRAHGHKPSVVDSTVFWAFHRGRLDRSEGPKVALLGKSRTAYGFATERFRERYPNYQLFNLSIMGEDCVATLIDLGNDESFKGIALCEITPYRLQPAFQLNSQPYVDKYYSAQPGELVEAVLSAGVQSQLAIVYPKLDLRTNISYMLREKAVRPPEYVIMRFDRSCIGDFTLVDVEQHRIRKVNSMEEALAKDPPLPPEEWAASLAPVRLAVERIQKRGGKVVFIHYPKRGEYYGLEDRDFPREQYWDRLGSLLGCDTLHFQDIPGIENIETPDNSHIDHRERAPFTDLILDWLESRGILEKPSGSRE